MLELSADKALDSKKAAFRRPDLELLIRDVRDRHGRRRRIVVKSWSTIKDVKDVIQQATHVPPAAQRLYFGPLITSGSQLPNHRSLHDVGIYRSGETLLLDIQGGSAYTDSLASPSGSSFRDHHELANDILMSSSVIEHAPKYLRYIAQQARRGFAMGLKPEFILDGSGGSYFLHDARKVKVAVYKPADEEPYAENNPRGYLKQPGQPLSLREGIVPGEACIREVAAFMLDHEGFSSVPMTTLAEARHPAFNTNGARLKVAEGGASIGAHSISALSSSSPSSSMPFGSPASSSSASSSSTTAAAISKHNALPMKVGSFQEFVRSECTMDDLSPSKIAAEEIHKIAILDIRIMNADRNSANLLCRRRPDNSIELVPIDHGFCLRSVADISWMDWCWLDWPQLKEPLSERSREYVMSLDVEADIRMLKDRLNLCQEALDIFRASTSILQAGVKAGLTLYDIAIMCCRNDNMGEIPSKLEVLFSMASELASSAVKNGRWNHETASRALTDQLSPMGGSLLAGTGTAAASSMRKSKSSLHMSNFQYNEIDGVPQKDIPEMIKSSASDSSSDTAEDDDVDLDAHNIGIDTDTDAAAATAAVTMSENDTTPACCTHTEYQAGCGEWAAALIADVSMEKSKRLMQKKQRSISIESETSTGSSNSGSPLGFWQKAPGSDDDDDSSLDIDDESVTWTPNVSPTSTRPTKSFLFAEGFALMSLKNSPLNINTFQPGQLIPPKMKKDTTVSKLQAKPNTTNKTVSFGLTPSPSLPRQEQQGMMRSKSFAALSTTSSSSDNNKTPDKQFRDYFLKFIDLVIVRETAAASRLANGL